jgi:energy-coupling factor transporter ATP-binding protein EcfA2
MCNVKFPHEESSSARGLCRRCLPRTLTFVRIVSVEIEGVGPFDHLTLPIRNGTDPDKADVVVIAGPNGSGKSTLLYAIAGCFVECRELADRFRSIEGIVSVGASFETGPARFRSYLSAARPTRQVETQSTAVSTHISMYGSGYATEIPTWWAQSGTLNKTRPDGSAANSLAFAYSGTRSLESTGQPINPGMRSADFQALSFEKMFSFLLFREWVSDVMGRRDAAARQGLAAKAGEIDSGLRILESFLSGVMAREVAFRRDLDDGTITLADGRAVVPLELLPEGLKSMLSWLGDLLRRLYSIPSPGTPQNELPFVLLLDEIDVHLHPKWQRLIVPALERLFPKAQVFITTHSPFVIFSASDAQIVWLDEGGKLREDLPSESLRGYEYGAILELMGIDSMWDATTKSQFEALNAAIADVKTDAKTRSEAMAVAAELPETPDVKMTVDMLFDQLDRDLQRR